jgi:hypothetical protein
MLVADTAGQAVAASDAPPFRRGGRVSEAEGTVKRTAPKTSVLATTFEIVNP